MHPHLVESQVTYSQHCRWALVAGARLVWAGVASILHAVYPGWFPATAARTVISLYHARLQHHPNPEYQEYIKQAHDRS